MPYKDVEKRRAYQRKKSKIWRERHPDKVKEQRQKYKERHLEKIRKREKKYREENPEKVSFRKKRWRENNKEKIREYERRRAKEDMFYIISKRLRKRIRNALTGGAKKSAVTVELLGCTIEEFKKYFESKFTEGMCWEKISEIHIDHIKPCSSFNLKNEEEQRACFHYTNLQPLWAEDNLKKGSKINV